MKFDNASQQKERFSTSSITKPSNSLSVFRQHDTDTLSSTDQKVSQRAERLRECDFQTVSQPSCRDTNGKDSTAAVLAVTGSSKPACHRFPYEQANPADCIEHAATIEIDASAGDTIEPGRANSDSCSSDMMSGLSLLNGSRSSATSLSSGSAKNELLHHEAPTRDHDDSITYLECLDHLLSERSSEAPKVGHDVDFTSVPTTPKERLLKQISSMNRPPGPQQSESTSAHRSADALHKLNLNGGYSSRGIRLIHRPLAVRPLGCTKLVKRHQLELWRNYSQHIAPWLDVLESRRQFQHTLPLMAKSSDALHYAALALSSRHMTLHDEHAIGEESVELCRDAERLLEAEIQSLGICAITAYFLLCVCDLMTYPPSECHDTLKACSSLFEQAAISARSSGFEQSLFWAFANVSVWSGTTALSLRQYYPSESLSTATSYIRSQTWGEGYAKYALYLTATVVATADGYNREPQHRSTAKDLNQWKSLHDLLEDWHNCRPEGMQPLMSYPSILDDARNRFPMVLYQSAAAVMGNLLYHAASILLLQCKPSMIELPKNHKSLAWHARQICGIVVESHEAGVLPHARQPLMVAAKYILEVDERQKIREICEDVERVSGWRSAWCIEDLRKEWSAM